MSRINDFTRVQDEIYELVYETEDNNEEQEQLDITYYNVLSKDTGETLQAIKSLKLSINTLKSCGEPKRRYKNKRLISGRHVKGWFKERKMEKEAVE